MHACVHAHSAIVLYARLRHVGRWIADHLWDLCTLARAYAEAVEAPPHSHKPQVCNARLFNRPPPPTAHRGCLSTSRLPTPSRARTHRLMPPAHANIGASSIKHHAPSRSAVTVYRVRPGYRYMYLLINHRSASDNQRRIRTASAPHQREKTSPAPLSELGPRPPSLLLLLLPDYV